MGRSLLSIDEAMSRTGLKRTSMFHKIGSGEIRSVKVGKRRLIPDSAIDEFIERLEADTTSSGTDVA